MKAQAQSQQLYEHLDVKGGTSISASPVSHPVLAHALDLPRIRMSPGKGSISTLESRCSSLQNELKACKVQIFALETELQRERSERALAVDDANTRFMEAAQALRTSHSEFMAMVNLVKKSKSKLRACRSQLSTYDDMLCNLSRVSLDLTEEKEKYRELSKKIEELELQINDHRELNAALDKRLYEKELELSSAMKMRDEYWHRLESVSESYNTQCASTTQLEKRIENYRIRNMRLYRGLANAVNNMILSAVLRGKLSPEINASVGRNEVQIHNQRFKFDRIYEGNECAEEDDTSFLETESLVRMAIEGQKVLVLNYGYVKFF